MSSNTILVVGGGFSGITAALEAAEVGYEVIIVEKNPYLGGRVSQLNQYFPKLCPPSCGLEIQFQRIKKNPRVKFLTMAEVVSVTGTPGSFTAKVRLRPRCVNENCTMCDACAQAAETLVDDEFNLGLNLRKAAYKPHLHAFPERYVFDRDACSPDEQQRVKASCKYDAIVLDDQEKVVEYNVGSVVWTTGWQPYDMTKLTTLGSGLVPNVVSNMQMERLASTTGPTGGKIVRPTDKKAPKRIAFVQCAGSRDQNHLNYCSYICCMASLKQATYVRAQYPDAKIVIFYIDIRTPGRYDQFYQKVASDPNIEFVKGKVAKIVDGSNHDPIATVENALTGIKSDERFDLIVLATGMQPSVAGQELPMAVPQDEEGFIVGGADKGIIAAGCANVPLDVTRSAQAGTGAALKAISTVVGR